MGTIRRLTDIQLGSIYSTKLLSITTSETLYIISSGARAIEVGNPSAVANLFYGSSSLAVNSGLLIGSSYGAKFWDTVTDNFQMYLRITSAGLTSLAIIHEYAGN